MKNSDWTECPDCGWENWLTKCWNCHAKLPVADKSELEGLLIGIYDKVRHGGVMHVGSIEKLIRKHFDVVREALRQEGGDNDE
jgi:hypothetical protein